MRFRDQKWRRGAPSETGVYLVFHRPRRRIEVINVLAAAPLQYRTQQGDHHAAWPYAAYLGPLAGERKQAV